MLTATHTVCGHSWLQYLLPTHTHVDTCPVCVEEDEERAAERRNNDAADIKGKNEYYHEKYGDEL